MGHSWAVLVLASFLLFSLIAVSNSLFLADAQIYPAPKPIPIPLGKPDLIIEELSLSPANPDTDDLITFKAVVKNTGTVKAGKSTLQFTIGGETPGPENQFSVPELEPGKTFTQTRQSTLTTPKTFGTTAIADALGAVSESNEDNNKKVVTFSVTKAVQEPIDTDKDGIPDSEDACPNDFGPRENKGCPVKEEPVAPVDTDGDGIPDDRDKCPREFGSTNNNGCPIQEVPRIEPAPTPIPTKDSVPPLLIVPKDITVDATNAQGAKVDFVVTAIDNVDGQIKPSCTKSSGTVFSIGTTLVECTAKDSSGNIDKKSFKIIVKPLQIVKVPEKPILAIPAYVKNIATFWQQNQIDDDSFVGAVKYLMDNEIISIPNLPKCLQATTKLVPNWIKTSTEFWISGHTSDEEYARSIQWLVQEGIIQVGMSSECPSSTASELNENQIPHPVNDVAFTCEGVSVTIPVLENDVNPGKIFWLSSVNPTSKASIENEKIRYTPPPNFVGLDSFTYGVTDGHDYFEATVDVTVYSHDDVVLENNAPAKKIAYCIDAEIIYSPTELHRHSDSMFHYHWTHTGGTRYSESVPLVVINYPELKSFDIELNVTKQPFSLSKYYYIFWESDGNVVRVPLKENSKTNIVPTLHAPANFNYNMWEAFELVTRTPPTTEPFMVPGHHESSQGEFIFVPHLWELEEPEPMTFRIDSQVLISLRQTSIP